MHEKVNITAKEKREKQKKYMKMLYKEFDLVSSLQTFISGTMLFFSSNKYEINDDINTENIIHEWYRKLYI